MNTIVTYKVVYVDQLGVIQEYDFMTFEQALRVKNSITGALLYKVTMIGSIEEIP